MSENDFGLEGLVPTKADLKKLVKKHKQTVMPLIFIIVIIVVLGPYYYMASAGFSLTKIGYYYAAGIVVIFFMTKMIMNMFKTSKPDRKDLSTRRNKAVKEIENIDKMLDEEAEVHKKRLAQIEAVKNGKVEKHGVEDDE